MIAIEHTSLRMSSSCVSASRGSPSIRDWQLAWIDSESLMALLRDLGKNTDNNIMLYNQ